jgi:hypothetical protein
MNLLRTSAHPLVVFPEGEIYHNNDHPAPFWTGAAALALGAARRSARRIVCVPAAIRYQYLGDPSRFLMPLVDRLEQHLVGLVLPNRPLAARVYRLVERIVSQREREYLGRWCEGPLTPRIVSLASTIVRRLERRYDCLPDKETTNQDSAARLARTGGESRTGCQPLSDWAGLPEQITRWRRLVIQRLEQSTPETPSYQEAARELEALHVAAQLFSYSQDYLEERPTLEHLGEILDKFEEDVLGAPLAAARGERRGTVLFGAPVIVTPDGTGEEQAARLTNLLQERVKELLSELQASARSRSDRDGGPWPTESSERRRRGGRLDDEPHPGTVDVTG